MLTGTILCTRCAQNLNFSIKLDSAATESHKIGSGVGEFTVRATYYSAIS